MPVEARGIKSIEVGGRILSVLTRASEAMMLRDLSSATDLTPAQAHAYLMSYRRIGLVEQDVHNGRYRLGPFALRLGLERVRSVQIMAEASKSLRLLSEEFGHMCVMAVWGRNGPTVIQVRDGHGSLNLNLREGTLFSVTGTATGHVFAAYSPAREVKEKIRQELSGTDSPPTISHVPLEVAFEAAIARTRQLGYAQAAGVPIPGVNAISVPVLDKANQLAMAITIIGSSDQLSLRKNSQFIKRIQQVAAELSRFES